MLQIQPKSPKAVILLRLFFSMFTISACTFGGGYVIVTFMKRKFVDDLHWITEAEMLDYIALAQSTPGAITVNAAILVGWHICGAFGMIAAVLGSILPPLGILVLVSVAYQYLSSSRWFLLVLEGMQAGVAAVILDVVFDLGKKVWKAHSVVPVVVMVTAFCAKQLFGINVIMILAATTLIGLIVQVWNNRSHLK